MLLEKGKGVDNGILAPIANGYSRAKIKAALDSSISITARNRLRNL